MYTEISTAAETTMVAIQHTVLRKKSPFFRNDINAFRTTQMLIYIFMNLHVILYYTSTA